MKLKRLFTHHNGTKSILFCAVSFLVLVAFKIYHLFSGSTYEDILTTISFWIGKPEWQTQLRSLFKLDDYTRVMKIKDLVFVFVLCIYGLFLYMLNQITKLISSYISFVKKQLKLILLDFKKLNRLELGLIFFVTVFFLVKAYYYVFTWPIQYDEAWTFSYYINNSWLTPFITPHNNHILYTILAKLTYHLLPFEAIYGIRFLLPIYSLITAILLFHIFSKYLKKELAVAGFILFLAIPGVIFYSLYARAYSLSMIFAALNLVCAFQIFKTNSISNNTLITLVLSSILGMYSLPSFVYFSIGIYGTIVFFAVIKKNLYLIQWLFISGLLFIMGTIILYSPMIMATKLSWLTEAAGYSSAKTNTLPFIHKFSLQSARFFYGNSYKISYLASIIASILFLVFYRKNAFIYGLCAIQLLIPIAYIIVKHQNVEERFFAFNTVITCLITTTFLATIFKHNRKQLYVFSIILFAYFSYHAHFQKFFNWSNQYDRTIRKMSYLLMDEGVDTTYLFLNYAKPGIGYHFDVNKKKIQLYLPSPVSKDYRPFSKQGEFPSILIDTSRQVYPSIDLDVYQLRLKEKELELYIRKDRIN